MVMERDVAGHICFCPLQSDVGQKILTEHGAPIDCSTAVLIDEYGVHTESSAILRMFPSMGFPYNVIGPVALLVPSPVRNFCYRLFAKHRGTIWKGVKKLFGMDDTKLAEHKDKVIPGALMEPVPEGWGFNLECAPAEEEAVSAAEEPVTSRAFEAKQ
mmetsp:Transcript_44503/g.88931  ORF Transcript_44503/g.88931 Transcript_44503/m.88931 type:complete len:158 (-) Transcript_44503:209-682(-)